jgi:hypothetical protein
MRLALLGEIGGQILIRVAVAIGAGHPDLLAAQLFPHLRQDAECVAEAVDALLPLLGLVHDQATPGGHHALNGTSSIG